MANVLKVHEQNAIQQLAAQGWSGRRIAQHLQIDRKTVRRYLKAAAKSPTISTPGSELKIPPISTPGKSNGSQLVVSVVGAEAGRPSFCATHRQRIESKLDAGLSAQRIYQDLVTEVGFSGSYQSVKRFVRQLRHQQPERVWRIEVKPSIKRSQIFELATGQFIGQHRDLLLLGPPGVGKSFLAQALGHAAIRAGFLVLYCSIFDLVRELQADQSPTEAQRALTRYLKPDLLCIDDFGMKHFPPKSAEALLELIVRRHQNRSTLLTSNRPIGATAYLSTRRYLSKKPT